MNSHPQTSLTDLQTLSQWEHVSKISVMESHIIPIESHCDLNNETNIKANPQWFCWHLTRFNWNISTSANSGTLLILVKILWYVSMNIPSNLPIKNVRQTGVKRRERWLSVQNQSFVMRPIFVFDRYSGQSDLDISEHSLLVHWQNYVIQLMNKILFNCGNTQKRRWNRLTNFRDQVIRLMFSVNNGASDVNRPNLMRVCMCVCFWWTRSWWSCTKTKSSSHLTEWVSRFNR
jgi:hypothetical protein